MKRGVGPLHSMSGRELGTPPFVCGPDGKRLRAAVPGRTHRLKEEALDDVAGPLLNDNQLLSRAATNLEGHRRGILASTVPEHQPKTDAAT